MWQQRPLHLLRQLQVVLQQRSFLAAQMLDAHTRRVIHFEAARLDIIVAHVAEAERLLIGFLQRSLERAEMLVHRLFSRRPYA